MLRRPIVNYALCGSLVVLGLAACSKSDSSGSSQAHSDNSSQGQSHNSSGEVQFESSTPYRFDTITELVATSDLVVEATVLSESRGQTIGEHGKRIKRLAKVEVLETFKGESPQTLTVIEDGWLEDGRSIIVDGVAPLTPNRRVILFLLRSTESGAGDMAFRVDSAGQYSIEGESVEAGHGGSPVLEKVKKMKPKELREAVREAQNEVVTKNIQPLKPVENLSRPAKD